MSSILCLHTNIQFGGMFLTLFSQTAAYYFYNFYNLTTLLVPRYLILSAFQQFRQHGWMKGCMDGQTDRCMDRCMNESMNKQIDRFDHSMHTVCANKSGFGSIKSFRYCHWIHDCQAIKVAAFSVLLHQIRLFIISPPAGTL